MALSSPTLFWLGAALCVASGIATVWLYRTELYEFTKTGTSSRVTFAVIVAVILIELATPVVITWDRLTEELPLPDVTFNLVNAKFPSIQAFNISAKVARDIRYTGALFNIDAPNHYQPLPIRVAGIDFIKPHQYESPHDLFSPVLGMIEPGNRIFGTISINCPECARGRTFYVYIVWGHGGWISLIDEEKRGAVRLPHADMDMAFIAEQVIPTIPPDHRIWIVEPVAN